MKMKARFSHMLAVLIAVFMILSTFSVFADGLGDGDWVYERTVGDKEYYIKSYTGTSEKVKIPALFQTKPVTKINDNAFLYNTLISYVEIPATVKNIGSNAFYGCKELKEVVMLGDVESIGAHAFYGCTMLMSVDMSKVSSLKEISRNGFSGCYNLKTITIPNGVEKIEDRAFFDCISLTSVVIPASVTSISDLAFKNCTGFTIYGYADSFAQTFATKNKIPFELIGNYVEPTDPDVPSVPTIPGTDPVPTTVPEPSASENTTQPSQGTTNTDPTEGRIEDTLPSNPLNTEPEGDPFDTGSTESSSQVTTGGIDPSESSTSNQDKKKYIIGDTDLSGKVTVKDATLIQKYAAGLVQFDRIQLFLGNCNATGDVNVKDATQVQKYCAGFLNILFVGQEVEI